MDENRILIIEDDEKFVRILTDYLQQHNFIVKSATDGSKGIELANTFEPKLIILDLMLPKVNGFTVCQRLRHWYRGGVLMLTACDDFTEQVACLEIGADDYLTKPISPRLLLAKVRTVLRRVHRAEHLNQRVQRFGSLLIDSNDRKVSYCGKAVELTDAEFELLEILITNRSGPVAKDVIMRKMRGIEYDGVDRSIDNRISTLRKKFADNPMERPKKIVSVRGKGYLFVEGEW